MKLFTSLFAVIAAVSARDMSKCDKLPKGGSRKYTTPRTIERGNNQPEAVNFLIDNRAKLNSIFRRGFREPAVLQSDISNNMKLLSTYSSAVDDVYMGQIFREGRQAFVNMISEGQKLAAKESTEFANLYRDNTQRLSKALRDVTYNYDIFERLEVETDFITPLIAHVAKDKSEGARVYQQFLETHGQTFAPLIKQGYSTMKKIRTGLVQALKKVVMDEKLKSGYRQLINELPLVYQFFNDNIDYIMMANMDKSLDDAVAADIMAEIAKTSGDVQIHSMINRNLKFIKKLMTERAQRQMKEKAVSKVMEKNAELKAAADNEAEFAKIIAEKEKEGKALTKEQKNKIWEDVVKAQQKKQKEDIGNQLENKDNTKHKPKKGLSRYEHLSAIVGLLPDELLQTVAEMVKQSCPEMDLMQIEDEDMQHIIEAQPENFLDQLLNELHDVCEMFGLIDDTKIMKKMIGGVEVEIYAADWVDSKKKEW